MSHTYNRQGIPESVLAQRTRAWRQHTEAEATRLAFERHAAEAMRLARSSGSGITARHTSRGSRLASRAFTIVAASSAGLLAAEVVVIVGAWFGVVSAP